MQMKWRHISDNIKDRLQIRRFVHIDLGHLRLSLVLHLSYIYLNLHEIKCKSFVNQESACVNRYGRYVTFSRWKPYLHCNWFFLFFFPTVFARNLMKVRLHVILNFCYLKYFRDNAGPSLKECFFASTGDYVCIVREVQDS